MVFNNLSQFSPPASPPSPCSSWPASSSSPASSPAIEPFSLEPDALEEDPTRQAPLIVVTDPLAASYHGKFPSTKRFAPSNFTISPKRPRLERKSSFPEISQVEPSVPDIASFREEGLWENAIERAFETGDGEIELRGLNLTNIPPRVIKDLSKMVVLPEASESSYNTENNRLSPKFPQIISGRRILTRIHTAPASTFAGSVSLALQDLKSTLSSNSLLGAVRHPMTMYLGQNSIKKLPVEMWTLQNLTVLSLRNNDIRFLPPGIGQLVNLQSLNIAYNKLEYVPSELMGMGSLTTLILFPNPFIPAPHPRTETRLVSKARYIGSRVPPLTEISLRALLAKPAISWTSPTQPFKTVLEELYPLPLPTGNMWRPVSAPLSRTLAICVPGSIVIDDKVAQDDHSGYHEVTGISLCPNPGHTKNVFIHHSEERYSWENTIAGIKIGGVAAMLWRGCQHGCLDFLGPPTDRAKEDATLPTVADADEREEGVNEQEGVEEVQEILLQSIEFTGQLDFDDE